MYHTVSDIEGPAVALVLLWFSMTSKWVQALPYDFSHCYAGLADQSELHLSTACYLDRFHHSLLHFCIVHSVANGAPIGSGSDSGACKNECKHWQDSLLKS